LRRIACIASFKTPLICCPASAIHSVHQWIPAAMHGMAVARIFVLRYCVVPDVSSIQADIHLVADHLPYLFRLKPLSIHEHLDATMLMSAQHPPGMAGTFPYAYSSFSTRKRRAGSPEPPSLIPTQDTPSAKRRRANLANGFSGLSLTPRTPTTGPSSPLPSYGESEATKDDIEDSDQPDGLFVRSPPPDDLHVEVLPSAYGSGIDSRYYHGNGHGNMSKWSLPATASSDEDDSDENGTFRLGSRTGLSTRVRRLASVAQQADEVVQPGMEDEGVMLGGSAGDVVVEDVTDLEVARGRKRSGESSERPHKRPRSGMDVDMDMDMDMGDDAEGSGEMTERRRRRTEWHEPEKDRE
jgi:hypothetical protein